MLPQVAEHVARRGQRLADDEPVRHVPDAGGGRGAERGPAGLGAAEPDRSRDGLGGILDLGQEADEVARQVVQRMTRRRHVDEPEQRRLELPVRRGQLHRARVDRAQRVARRRRKRCGDLAADGLGGRLELLAIDAGTHAATLVVMRRLGSGLAVIVMAMLAGGCGSSASSTPAAASTGSGQPTQPVTATSSSASTTSSATTATTASTSTTAGIPACTAADLALSFESSNGAAGNTAAFFEFKNTSSSPCHTYGYPGVLFLTKSGAALPTTANRTTHDLIGTSVLAKIVIDPGQVASFHLVVGLSATGQGCSTAYGLQAIAPDDIATIHTQIPDGLYECGTATVSPLALGNGIPAGT